MESAGNHLSAEQILAAIEQLPLPDIERLADRVIALQAKRRASHLNIEETALMLRINQTLPTPARARLRELIAKRDAETISPHEQQELIHLTDRLEELHADRLEALGQLAQVRGVTLSTVMQQLGLQFPDHD